MVAPQGQNPNTPNLLDGTPQANAPLRALANELDSVEGEHSRVNYRLAVFVKGFLIGGGALVVAVAEGVEIANSNGAFSGWTIAVFAGAAIVAIGSVALALTEENAAKSLQAGRRAIENARFYRRQMGDFEIERKDLESEIERALQLYNSMDVMRGTIEEGLRLPNPDIQKIVGQCLENARNSLLVALDFDIRDTWTICVYMAERDASGKAELRCIAAERSIRCELSAARRWREGVGVAGVCYSMANEVIIPDMAAPEIATMFNLKAPMTRDYDDTRYRSMAAIQIVPDKNQPPWGVALVTSDRPHHFSVEPTDGMPTAQPIRTIAAMVSLAVAATRSQVGVDAGRVPGDSPQDGGGATTGQGGPAADKISSVLQSNQATTDRESR